MLESDEVTSLCPVTGQPDWETVRIEFEPGPYCIESKSLKLYLWSFREEGAFCEALAARIAQDVYEACKPAWVKVTVTQKPRGGSDDHRRGEPPGQAFRRAEPGNLKRLSSFL